MVAQTVAARKPQPVGTDSLSAGDYHTCDHCGSVGRLGATLSRSAQWVGGHG